MPGKGLCASMDQCGLMAILLEEYLGILVLEICRGHCVLQVSGWQGRTWPEGPGWLQNRLIRSKLIVRKFPKQVSDMAFAQVQPFFE